jgi:hypothetical protein
MHALVQSPTRRKDSMRGMQYQKCTCRIYAGETYSTGRLWGGAEWCNPQPSAVWIQRERRAAGGGGRRAGVRGEGRRLASTGGD